jgi:hypothetical protein
MLFEHFVAADEADLRGGGGGGDANFPFSFTRLRCRPDHLQTPQQNVSMISFFMLEKGGAVRIIENAMMTSMELWYLSPVGQQPGHVLRQLA